MKIITTTKLLPTKEEAEILEKATTILEKILFNVPPSSLANKVNKAYEALYDLDEEIDFSIVNGVNEEDVDGEIEELFSSDFEYDVIETTEEEIPHSDTDTDWEVEEDDEFFHS